MVGRPVMPHDRESRVARADVVRVQSPAVVESKIRLVHSDRHLRSVADVGVLDSDTRSLGPRPGVMSSSNP